MKNWKFKNSNPEEDKVSYDTNKPSTLLTPKADPKYDPKMNLHGIPNIVRGFEEKGNEGMLEMIGKALLTYGATSYSPVSSLNPTGPITPLIDKLDMYSGLLNPTWIFSLLDLAENHPLRSQRQWVDTEEARKKYAEKSGFEYQPIIDREQEKKEKRFKWKTNE